MFNYVRSTRQGFCMILTIVVWILQLAGTRELGSRCVLQSLLRSTVVEASMVCLSIFLHHVSFRVVKSLPLHLRGVMQLIYVVMDLFHHPLYQI